MSLVKHHPTNQKTLSTIQLNEFPVELLIQIFEILISNNFLTLILTTCMQDIATTCTQFNNVMQKEYLWRRVYHKFGLTLQNTNSPHIQLLKLLKRTWDTKHSSTSICISENGRRVNRQSLVETSNPAVLGKYPLQDGESISIKVLSMGLWLSIGLATHKFVLDYCGVLGYQKYMNGTTDPNYGLYSFSSYYTRILKPNSQNEIIPFNETIWYKANDVVKLHRRDSLLYVFFNSYLVSCHIKLPMGYDFYPCVSLSDGSSVEFV